MARPLKKTERVLDNGIVLKSHEFDLVKDPGACKNKFRHWTAEKGGKLYGEFKSWQKSIYHPSEKEYGRNGGSYSSKMVKVCWVVPSGVPFDEYRSVSERGYLFHAEWPDYKVSETMQYWAWTREIKAIKPPPVEVRLLPATDLVCSGVTETSLKLWEEEVAYIEAAERIVRVLESAYPTPEQPAD